MSGQRPADSSSNAAQRRSFMETMFGRRGGDEMTVKESVTLSPWYAKLIGALVGLRASACVYVVVWALAVVCGSVYRSLGCNVSFALFGSCAICLSPLSI